MRIGLRKEKIPDHWASDARFERRLYLLLQELFEINMVAEKGMSLDFLGTIDAESLGRISCKEACKNAACFRFKFGSKPKRVVKDLPVHIVCHLWKYDGSVTKGSEEFFANHHRREVVQPAFHIEAHPKSTNQSFCLTIYQKSYWRKGKRYSTIALSI